MRRIIQTLLILLVVLAAASTGLVVYYDLRISRLAVTDTALAITSGILFASLLLLITRYLMLAVFSFLQHLRQAKRTEETQHYPAVSVIIPALNEGAVIESAIESAIDLDYPSFEVIVIDDGSTDDTYERALRLCERYGSARLRVFSKPNGGKASALNLGIRHARGELVLCTDADSRLEPLSLRHAARHFADPRVAAVAGNVKVANRLNAITKLQALEYIEGLNLVRSAQAFFRRITVVPGPVGMFRRNVLLEIGGYDLDTFAEDCDLTLRLMLAGYDVEYESEAIAWTEAPESSHSLLKQRYRWGRGILQSIIKHRSFLIDGSPSFASWLMLWLFVFESVVMPVMNLAGTLAFAITTLAGGFSSLIALWWAQLTTLDVMVALLCIAAEQEQISLAIWAIPYRLFFVPFVDMIRAFAWVDELFKVRMAWMRLERIGRI